MIRGLAHEVKNPLGGIRGAAQLAGARASSAALSEYTGVIIAEADRLKDLVDRMLGPHQRPNIEAVYLPEICEHVIAVAASEFSDRIEWFAIMTRACQTLPVTRPDNPRRCSMWCECLSGANKYQRCQDYPANTDNPAIHHR